jgi:ribosomal protein S12 methylthiotransferase
MRGKHKSTPEEQLVKNAESLVTQGTKELILIAQDLTYYGLDIYGKRTLADLLRKLSDVNGLDWIRLHYAYPSGFPMDVIDVMKERDNICNYLDIPLQHGSSRMLKAMRRGINREKTTQLIHDIRDKIPEIAIRTTLIAGYPGETEEDFQEMYDWVEEMRFDRMGCFTYSHEENTHAYNFDDDVPDNIKQSRASSLMDLQSGISFEMNQEKVNKTFKVLFDKMENGYFIGRTEYDSPEVDNEIRVKSDQYVRIGDFANVKIDKAEHFDLYGTVVE